MVLLPWFAIVLDPIMSKLMFVSSKLIIFPACNSNVKLIVDVDNKIRNLLFIQPCVFGCMSDMLDDNVFMGKQALDLLSKCRLSSTYLHQTALF